MNEGNQGGPSQWKEDQWGYFLDDLKSGPGRYIPVIGPELMVVRDGDSTHNLLGLLAQRVADKLRVPSGNLPVAADLKDVIRAYQTGRGRYDVGAPYTAIIEALAESNWSIPEPVRKLASIRHFSFFLNATWLPFLPLALAECRELPVVEKSNTLGKPMEDFEVDDVRSSLCVFNLFGSTGSSMSGCPNTFSVTDDDFLEGMHRLISNPPERLSNHLLADNRELLVCGCSFSNWLARFFIYSLARTAPLAVGQGLRMRVVAENQCLRDESLQAFWARLNVPVYDGQSAVAFVDELYDRWHAEFGDMPDPLALSSERSLTDRNPFSTGQIFISYARGDAEAAQRLATRLKDAGLPVWLDADCLGNGDLYRARIRSNIQYCSVFMPLISLNAIRNIEKKDFMYLEEWQFAWEQAELRRDGGMGQHDFILPVCIDPTVNLYDTRLPQYIRERHIVSLADDVPDSWMTTVNAARQQLARDKKGGAR